MKWATTRDRGMYGQRMPARGPYAGRMTRPNDYLADVFGLDGRVAVVTGGSSGIGKAAPPGKPDILVNCAGTNGRPPMNELDDDVWDDTLALNLTAPFLLGQRFGPGMAECGFARIIHISSQQAYRAFVDSGAYGVFKGGLE